MKRSGAISRISGNGKSNPAKQKKEFDKWFSLYIRLTYARAGSCTCYTCGKRLPWKSMQAGHFIPRNILITRWSEDNVRPQCVGCNVFGNGKILDFEEHLRKDLGDKAVDALKQSRHQIVKLGPLFYPENIAYYKQKVELLLEK